MSGLLRRPVFVSGSAQPAPPALAPPARAWQRAAAPRIAAITPDWSEIRRRYEAGDAVAAVAVRFAIPETALQTRRRREGWHRLATQPPQTLEMPQPQTTQTPAAVPVLVAPIAVPEPAPAPAPRKASVRTSALRRALIRRFYGAIDTGLKQLELRMQNEFDAGASASAADWERETRALGVLIANLGKVTEFEAAALAKPRAARPGARKRRRSDIPADDAERLRASLAERLERIVDRLPAGRNAGPDRGPDRGADR